MTGTIFRLPDDMHLQRGVTFTILPDGKSLRVPAMSRITVRAASQSHAEDNDHDMVQALQDILSGKKPVTGRARMNRRGQAHGNRVDAVRGGVRGGPAPLDPNAGFRPVMEGGQQVAEM